MNQKELEQCKEIKALINRGETITCWVCPASSWPSDYSYSISDYSISWHKFRGNLPYDLLKWERCNETLLMNSSVVFHYLEEEYDLQNNWINAYMKPLCNAIFHTPWFLILSRIVVFTLNGWRLLWRTIMLCWFLWWVVYRYRYYIKRRNIVTTSLPR